MIVWRNMNIIKTVLYCVVCHNCAQ